MLAFSSGTARPRRPSARFARGVPSTGRIARGSVRTRVTLVCPRGATSEEGLRGEWVREICEVRGWSVWYDVEELQISLGARAVTAM